MKKRFKFLFLIICMILAVGCTEKSSNNKNGSNSNLDFELVDIGGKEPIRYPIGKTLSEDSDYSEISDFLDAYIFAVFNSFSCIIEYGNEITYIETPTRNSKLEYDVALHLEYYDKASDPYKGLFEYEKIFDTEYLKEMRIRYKNKEYTYQVTTYNAEPGTARVRKYWESYFSNPYQEYLYHSFDDLPEIETVGYIERKGLSLKSYEVKVIDEENVEIYIVIEGNAGKTTDITYKINTVSLDMIKSVKNSTDIESDAWITKIHSVGEYIGIDLPEELDSIPKMKERN